MSKTSKQVKREWKRACAVGKAVPLKVWARAVGWTTWLANKAK